MDPVTKTKVSFFTLGCRLNQGETALLEGLFKEKGFRVVDFREPADILVLNSCTVTEGGEAAGQDAMKKALRLNPSLRIAVIGCQAQVQKEKLLALPGVHWVVGTARKMKLADILGQELLSPEKKVCVPGIRRGSFVLPLTQGFGRRMRANLKIQDGCDNFCAYCEIPYARGRSRSREFGNVLDEARALADAGHQEIVISGVNIGDYFHDGKGLADLVRFLEKINGLERIRISSLESIDLPLELVPFMSPPHKLCRFLHLPIQSGCDRILRRMGRGTTTAGMEALLRRITGSVPGIMIGTDIITGFPGETENHFEETREFLARAPFHYFHVFSYSSRQRARSRTFQGQVPEQEIARRSAVLRTLSTQKRSAFLSSLIGRRERVLFEHKKDQYWIGHLDNYVTIKSCSGRDMKNMFADVILESVDGEMIKASLAA